MLVTVTPDIDICIGRFRFVCHQHRAARCTGMGQAQGVDGWEYEAVGRILLKWRGGLPRFPSAGTGQVRLQFLSLLYVLFHRDGIGSFNQVRHGRID